MKIKKTLRDIAITAIAITIGTPLGIWLAQPFCYSDTQARLERMEKENPIIARNFSETLAEPSRDILSQLVGVGYGTQRATKEYLTK